MPAKPKPRADKELSSKASDGHNLSQAASRKCPEDNQEELDWIEPHEKIRDVRSALEREVLVDLKCVSRMGRAIDRELRRSLSTGGHLNFRELESRIRRCVILWSEVMSLKKKLIQNLSRLNTSHTTFAEFTTDDERPTGGVAAVLPPGVTRFDVLLAMATRRKSELFGLEPPKIDPKYLEHTTEKRNEACRRNEKKAGLGDDEE